MSVTRSSQSISINEPFSLSASLNKIVERKKLVLRANKYKNKEDRGGIAYLLNTVRRGHIVFDIGAHKGGYLYFMRQQVGTKGNVYAFEPQQLLYQYLQKIKTTLHWANVTVESFAVSDAEGEATLYVPYNHGRESSPGATIIDSLQGTLIQRTEPVTTIALDIYCIYNDIKPSFLKIDVEGNELKVFRGAEKLLKYHKPRILFECEARHVGKEQLFETLDRLKNLGYKGYFICGEEKLPLSQFQVEKYQAPDSGTYCNNFIFE